MFALLSYRTRKGAFYIGFLLTIIGGIYLTFNYYFEELLPQEKGSAQSYLHETNQSIDISNHQRSKGQSVTIQTSFVAFNAAIPRYQDNLTFSEKSAYKNYRSHHFYSSSVKTLLLFCHLIV